jgi:hypothetical protein
MHLGAVRPPAYDFRVLAVLSGGDSALVYLGASRREVLGLARQSGLLVPRVAGLLLQRWVGGPVSGYWQTMPLRRGELETPRREGHRRRFRDLARGLQLEK